jgi:hypothetical protein
MVLFLLLNAVLPTVDHRLDGDYLLSLPAVDPRLDSDYF